jgi:hypothetical protein
MCWRCDNLNGTTEEDLDELRETIRVHGWAVQGVEDDRLPYAYDRTTRPRSAGTVGYGSIAGQGSTRLE